MPIDPEVAQQLDEIREELKRLDEARARLARTSPPVGSILLLTSAQEPEGYLLCDGRAVSRAEYADLFAVIGETFGAGDGATTFGLPDTRGVFLRFLDLGAGRDANRTLGTMQGDATCLPRNPLVVGVAGSHTHSLGPGGGHSHPIQPAGSHSHGMGMAGSHRHNDGGFDNLLIYDATGTVKYGDNNDDPARREPNLYMSRPMLAAGDHVHAIQAVGDHSHTLGIVGDHTHLVADAGQHDHPISGGDAETRPANIAFVGLIRYGV